MHITITFTTNDFFLESQTSSLVSVEVFTSKLTLVVCYRAIY